MAGRSDTSCATQGIAVTPNDTQDLSGLVRSLWVGTGGDLVVIFADGGSSVTLKNVPSGTLMPIQVKRVMVATTATDIVALY